MQGHAAMLQLSFDDNLFNSAAAVIASSDQTFSLRHWMSTHPKTKPLTSYLTTSTLNVVFPQFVEEYGDGKKVDVRVSPSHSLFSAGFPNSKMTGVYIDKSGNWKI